MHEYFSTLLLSFIVAIAGSAYVVQKFLVEPLERDVKRLAARLRYLEQDLARMSRLTGEFPPETFYGDAPKDETNSFESEAAGYLQEDLEAEYDNTWDEIGEMKERAYQRRERVGS